MTGQMRSYVAEPVMCAFCLSVTGQMRSYIAEPVMCTLCLLVTGQTRSYITEPVTCIFCLPVTGQMRSHITYSYTSSLLVTDWTDEIWYHLTYLRFSRSVSPCMCAAMFCHRWVSLAELYELFYAFSQNCFYGGLTPKTGNRPCYCSRQMFIQGYAPRNLSVKPLCDNAGLFVCLFVFAVYHGIEDGLGIVSQGCSGRLQRVCRWLMRPVCVRNGQLIASGA